MTYTNAHRLAAIWMALVVICAAGAYAAERDSLAIGSYRAIAATILVTAMMGSIMASNSIAV